MKKRFSLINYNAQQTSSHESDDLAEILTAVTEGQTTWITINHYTPEDEDVVTQLLSYFAITSVTAEQILNHNLVEFTGESQDCLYAEFGIPSFDLTPAETRRIWDSIILGKHYLLLFTNNDSDIFDHTRDKVLTQNSRLHHHGPDYLLYLLTRAIIIKLEDALYSNLVERFELLEDEVIASQGEPEILDSILALREQVKPFYETVRRLGIFIDTIDEDDRQFISKQVNKMFNTRIEANIESLWLGYSRLRDWATELMDIHRANVGERTNRIMHILTVVSTIFLPITFLASLYGMNFQDMSFLDDPYGYYKTLLFMGLIAAVMLIYMKKKKWI